VTDAIQSAIDHLDHDRGKDSKLQYEVIGPARTELAALRAENEQLHAERRRNAIAGQATMEEAYATIQAQARQIAALREALHYVLEHLELKRPDLAAKDAAEALSSVPPSSMRLVPLEGLREIEWAGWDETLQVPCCPACMTTQGLGDGHAPDCWLAAAIAGKETV